MGSITQFADVKVSEFKATEGSSTLPDLQINLKITIMKKALCYFLLALITICQCYFVAQTYKQHKLLQQYRDFIDYLDKTDETFEVAMETDYYTIDMQEDRL